MLPGDARARPDQRQRRDRHDLRLEADRPDARAERDRQGLPRLHAAAGDVLGRGRDDPLPVARPARGPRRPGGLPRHGLDRRCARSTSCSSRRASPRPCWPSRSCASSTSAARSTPDQTTVVAGALAAFSLGLTFNGMMLMLNRGFFGLQAPWTPTLVALVLRRPQHRALRGLLPRRHLGDPARDLAGEHRRRGAPVRRAAPARRTSRPDARPRVRSCSSCSPRPCSRVVSYGVWWALDDALGRSLGAQLVSLGVALAAGGAAYLVACRALGVREIATLLSLRARSRRD